MGVNDKGIVCVTGGSGFFASWLIMKLLEHGYSVNTTIRLSKERKRNISYLTDLPGASERLRIFDADLEKPDSFGPAIEGCVGVFHVSHPIVLNGKETEEENTKKALNGTLGILQACLNAKTVKRVVYTSTTAAVWFCKGLDIVDESNWTDIDYIRSLNRRESIYSISKTTIEKACLEFAEKHGLDLVTVLPSGIHGPFITPNLPISVGGLMTLIEGPRKSSGESDSFEVKNDVKVKNDAAPVPPTESGGLDTSVGLNVPLVHTDDLARAHIFLFEYADAKGRYICSALETTMPDLAKFLCARYPEYQILSPDILNMVATYKYPAVSSKKLLDTGFKFKYGLEEMYDDAIRCCKEKGLLLLLL